MCFALNGGYSIAWSLVQHTSREPHPVDMVLYDSLPNVLGNIVGSGASVRLVRLDTGTQRSTEASAVYAFRAFPKLL